MTVMASMLLSPKRGLSPFATTTQSMAGKKPSPLDATLAEVIGFFAVMFIVMLVFYFFGQWLYNTGHGPKMKAIADKVEVFQNRLAGRVYKDMTRSVDKIDKMRRWPFGRRK